MSVGSNGGIGSVRGVASIGRTGGGMGGEGNSSLRCFNKLAAMIPGPPLLLSAAAHDDSSRSNSRAAATSEGQRRLDMWSRGTQHQHQHQRQQLRGRELVFAGGGRPRRPRRLTRFLHKRAGDRGTTMPGLGQRHHHHHRLLPPLSRSVRRRPQRLPASAVTDHTPGYQWGLRISACPATTSAAACGAG